MDHSTSSPRSIRSRIGNACDGCKARKVKCDGNLPCTYCKERGNSSICVYSPAKRRRNARTPISRDESHVAISNNTSKTPSQDRNHHQPAVTAIVAVTNEESREAAEDDDAEVSREARLLFDTQGKLIFIGDCAPLSFFQSVRQLVTSKVSPNAFAPETSRYSVLENAPARQSRQSRHGAGAGAGRPPRVDTARVAQAIRMYLSTTSGLIDLFDNTTLTQQLLLWANISDKNEDIASVVRYLVLAIGHISDDEELAHEYFEYARDRAYTDLSENLSEGTVKAFVLITVYMLCSCQINGAFLFFGIAGRAAYSIGVHRTEVNARFGPEVHRTRDRLWKSLRVLDLYMSTAMGRPPATSDVDCTVAYRAAAVGAGGGADGTTEEEFDLLNAASQIFLITEKIVLKVFTREKVPLALTEGVSGELRAWSERWLPRLRGIVEDSRTKEIDTTKISGSCQVLAIYYYSVILVSRSFLMFELYKRLSDGPTPGSIEGSRRSSKTKLADACIDAAIVMVESVSDLVERRVLSAKAPMLVSWLFAASLVLGVGLMGGFGSSLERYTRISIQMLDYFALKGDRHAAQYSLIAQSLLTTALEDLERRESREQMLRSQSSRLLFGLMPSTPKAAATVNTPQTAAAAANIPIEPFSVNTASPGLLGDMDSAYFGLSGPQMHTPDMAFWTSEFAGEGIDAGSTLNLFPLQETGGGIDLAHYPFDQVGS